jgi:peptidoglycan hydrolase CwlO-like protein
MSNCFDKKDSRKSYFKSSSSLSDKDNEHHKLKKEHKHVEKELEKLENKVEKKVDKKVEKLENKVKENKIKLLLSNNRNISFCSYFLSIN